MESISDVLSSTYTNSELKHVIGVIDKENTGTDKYLQRRIRTDAESKLLSRSKAVLDQMKPLATNLESLGHNIRACSGAHKEISSIVREAQASTSVYAENARFLQSEADSLTKQAAVLDAYMDAFYISDKESAVLTGTELTPEFFTALNRVKRIQAESAALLLAESPSSGEHLMLETRKLLDQAYQRIKSSILMELKQKSSRGAAAAESAAAPSNLRRSMALLADRPLLFKDVLQEQSGMRKEHLVRDLSQFLAVEQPNARAMPVRYLGSVLAWLHAAIVNEFEHIGLLLDPDAPPEDGATTSERSLEQLLSTSDTRQIITELVDSVMSSVEPSLRQKINAVVLAQTNAATVNELESVLMFYEVMLSKYEQPTVVSLLEQLKLSLDRQFNHIVDTSHSSWESRIDIALEVVKTHDSGVYSDTTITQSRLTKILDDALERELMDSKPIAALNTLDLAISRLAGYVVVQPKLERFRKLENEYALQQEAAELRAWKADSKLAELQNGSISAREFLIAFDQFLSVAAIDLQTRLESLQSPTIQNRIVSSVVEKFISEYEFATKDVANARPSEEIKYILV